MADTGVEHRRHSSLLRSDLQQASQAKSEKHTELASLGHQSLSTRLRQAFKSSVQTKSQGYLKAYESKAKLKYCTG